MRRRRLSSSSSYPRLYISCLGDGQELTAKSIVIATGTFLRGEIHLGKKAWPAGRINDPASIGLATALYTSGLEMGRMRTGTWSSLSTPIYLCHLSSSLCLGTPPRLDKHSIHFEHLIPQFGDAVPTPFSYLNTRVDHAVMTLIHPSDPCHDPGTVYRTLKSRVIKQEPHLKRTD